MTNTRIGSTAVLVAIVWMNNLKGKPCPVPPGHELRITFNHPPTRP